MKPWQKLPIIENNEKLGQIPNHIKFIDPHPYFSLGAPYKDKNKLWNLREGVILLLLKADKYLKSINNDYSLIVYDSWRPLEVQKFMFELAIKDQFMKKGINIPKDEIYSNPKILKKVEGFWANPFTNDNSPPPHSTGGAIDISLVSKSGELINMGCEIDELDDRARPDFFRNKETKEYISWNNNRILLQRTMLKFGFAQHPNEWWHFSYGDQLWAWKNKKDNAIYGKISN